FQAEDSIRDFHVTGVQTCALPISVWFLVVVVGGVLVARNWDKLLELWKSPELKRIEAAQKSARGKPDPYSREPVVHMGEFGGARSEERRVGREWCGRRCVARWYHT